MPPSPPASIVIPTRDRPAYLEVALASIAPQAAETGSEVVVVDDAGATLAARALAARYGARYEAHPRPLGLNAARNTGVDRSAGELVVFVDDDVRAHGAGCRRCSPRLAPGRTWTCSPARSWPRWRAPRRAAAGASARRSRRWTSARATPTRAMRGEPTWRSAATRWRASGRLTSCCTTAATSRSGRIACARSARAHRVRYVAAAGLDHRRAGADARLRALAATAYARGRAARRFDARRGGAPTLLGELTTFAGCLWHVARRRCPSGLTMAAHSAGRLRETPLHRSARPVRRAEEPPARDDFLSGASGTVGGLDSLRRIAIDSTVDALQVASGRRLRLRLAARHAPACQRVLVLGVEREEHRANAQRMRAQLLRSRHDVRVHTCPPQGRGKFQNLNSLLAAHPLEDIDWLLVVDDDVQLPRGFLDELLFLCDRFSLQLAQPAHRLDSHAAWPQTRRRAASVVRESCFVEIGPVTAFARATFSTLLPFPELGMGWGLDVHWAALARERGWRCGVIDATAIRHRDAPAGDGYSREAAVAEAREFLADRPYLSAREAQRTLAVHRRW